MMKQFYKIIFLFVLMICSCVLNATTISNNLASLTATISGTTTVCQNAAQPQITFTGSGGTAPYTFTYTVTGFGGNQIISTTGTNSSVTISVNTTTATTLNYTLVSVHDATNPTTEILITGIAATITIKASPDASIGGTGSGSNFNGVPVFRICSNTVSAFTFTNISSTTSLNSNYTINWGDGSPNFNSTTWSSTPHTYAVGLWNLTYSIQGNNGCNTTKNYIVFVGSNPAVSLGNPGNTDICISSSLTFPITGTANNPPGTTYTVTFNDGSSPETFNHPPPLSVTHTFLKSSCGVTSSDGTNSYPNSFSAIIVASNPCNISSVGVVPIYVSTPPIANFSLPTIGCVNSPICMTNTSTGAFENNGSNSSCNTNPKIIWSISPSTGFSISSGSLGNDFSSSDPNLWLTGSNTLCLNFSQAGTYTITIKTGNRCGYDTKTQQICIEEPLTPVFTLNTTEGCSPVTVTATNNTNSVGSCSPPTYLWKVTYTAGYCGSGVTTIPDQTTQNATYNFVKPGTYSIKLTTTNSCGPVTSLPQTVIVKQPPKAVINPIAIVCQTIPTTSISPTAVVQNCGSQALSYAWSFPNGTPSISTLAIPGAISYAAPGNYTVSLTVTNECGSTIATDQTFTINPVPVLTNTSLSQAICSGLPTTLVNLTSNLVGTTFSWTATATTGISGFAASGTTATLPVQTISTTNSSPGTVTYSITPSKAGCSGAPVDYVITVNPAPTITQPASSSVCIGGTPTILSVSVSNAIAAPSYQWYSNTSNNNSTGTSIPGETNLTYSPPATTVGTTYYYCIITLPSGGCSNITSNTATVTIAPFATISLQPVSNQSICVGGIIAPLTVGYTGGTGTATYQWYSNSTNTNSGGTPISGATTSSFTPPAFNTIVKFYYYAEINFSGNGCGSIKSDPAEIIVVATPTITQQPLASQTLCQGASPTTLSVAATGGIGTFSYQWFSNGINSNSGGTSILGETNITFTPPTTIVETKYYYCFISQVGLNCIVTSTTAKVIVNTAPTITQQPQSSTICLSNAPIPLSVSYSNGVGTPQYQWYSNTTNSTLGSNAVSGGTNSSFNPSATTVGTIYYYCIVTLPTGGCSNLTTNIAAVTVNQNPVISNKNKLICSGNAFTITPNNSSGDIVPIGTTYTWTNPIINPINAVNGATGQNSAQNNISQTLINTTTSTATVTYTVTPLSGVCLGSSFSVVITVNPSISPNITLTTSTCFGANNGGIQTNIIGGIPFNSGLPYLISWSGPNSFSSSAPSIFNLAPADYTLSITDAGGCPFSKNYTITEPADIVITTDLKKDITCFGNANGSIAITISGGTPNYTFAWTKNGAPYATTEDLSNLGPGIYEVTVSDVNNCGPKTATFTIKEPPILAVNLVNQTNILCFGDATGAINVNAVGGTLPYTFAWTGPNGFTSSTQNLTAILAGTYNLKVTDNSGCSINLSPVTITQTPEISITATTTPIICYGGNDASIRIAISGGISPYQIVWSNLGSGTFQNNLSSGNYLITVTDALGCPKTLNVNIPAPPIFTTNPVVKQISCSGANDGSINLNIIGGIAPLKLVWDDNASAGNIRNNLGPGTYNVTITDGKPCEIKKHFMISDPQPLVLSAIVTDASDCVNANSGAINLLVSGGTTPFTYAWSNGATTEDLNNIPAGNYLVTVTDVNVCSKQAQYSINRPPPIVVGVVTKTDFDCVTKYVKQTFVAQVSGGVPPYQLAWSSGTASGVNNEFMNTNQNGTAILNVTDKLGCPANYSFNVKNPTLGNPSFNISSYAVSTFGIYSIKDPIQFTNTTTGDFISIYWDFGDGSFSNETNPIHTFLKEGNQVVTQTVTYPFGCFYINPMTLKIEKGYELISPNTFTPNGDGINDTFRPVFKGMKSIYLSIYDTWGELIYSENGTILHGWDGKIKGKDAENGNFYYKVNATTFYGDVINDNNPFVLIK